MAEQEIAPPAKRHLVSTTEVVAHLRRTLDTRRFYATGHPAVLAMVTSFLARLRAHLVEWGNLDLNVTSLALLLGDKPVLAAERREESVSHPLYLDGVRSLSIRRDAPDDEIVRFLEIWNQSMQPGAADGQTFPTRLWESGIKTITAVSADALVEGATEVADFDRALEELQAGTLSFHATSAGSVAASQTDPFEADTSAPMQGAADTRGELVSWSREEAAAIAEEATESRQESAERALFALVNLTVLSATTDRAPVERGAREVFRAFAMAGEFAPLAGVAKRIAEGVRAQRREHKTPTLLISLLEQLGSEEVVTPALAALTDPKVSEAALDVLRFVPSTSVGPLLDAIPGIKDPESREKLVVVIAGILPAVAPLELRAASFDEAGALQVLRIAKALPASDAAGIQARALKHTSAKVRKAALADLKTAQALAHVPVLIPLLDDPDAGVRRPALDLLVRAQAEGAVPAIVARLANAEMEEGERKLLYLALANLGGETAMAALRSEFSRDHDAELRSAAAMALAQAGDESALPLLQKEAKRWFASRTLKDACKAAIKRLEARQAQATTGSAS